MPDPKLALPVRVEEKSGKFVVVDANGSRVADGGSFDDKARAATVAGRINKAWKAAAAERRSKGAPEVTREARVERLAGRARELLERAAAGTSSSRRTGERRSRRTTVPPV